MAISIGCYALLNFTSANPYIAIIILGVAYRSLHHTIAKPTIAPHTIACPPSLLASALWPIAALLIPEYQLGTAYGLMQVHTSI